MLRNLSDTIVALATPPGEGGLAVIRVSGADAIKLTGGRFKGKTELSHATSHTAHFGEMTDGRGEVLDEVVCTVFCGPHSYTGENTVEISCHGGVLVSRRILEALMEAGARAAEPGEFTKRAFLNGKMDLSQAEAVADLIHARTDLAHKSSLLQLEGVLSARVRRVRDALLDAIGLLELELDFAEDGYEFVDKTKAVDQISRAIAATDELLATYKFGRVYREGVKLVLAGAPNVGKSSLLNALLNENRAIVTDIPGTTRDVIEESLNIGGVLFRIVDTAGLRDTSDPVEVEGVRRTRTQVATSDIVLLLLDASKEPTPEEVGQATDLLEEARRGRTKAVVVLNKVDLLKGKSSPWERRKIALGGEKQVWVSALTGTGLGDLKLGLLEKVFDRVSPESTGGATVTSSRHYEALLRAHRGLGLALDSLNSGKSGEFIAVDLRSALDSLGEIIGEVTTEDILNSVFSKFCIGK